MNKIKGVLFVLISVALISATAWAAEKMMQHDVKVEYSADEYMETEDVTMHSKVFHAPNKDRKEQDMGGMKQIMINRMDKKLIWMLMPEQKMYMEMRIDETKGKEEQGDLKDYKVEYSVVGEEVVNGVNTTKSKVVVTDPKGNKFGGFMWESKEGIMVKMDTVGKAEGTKMRMKIELKNLKIEKQDPRLFEIPSGYSKMGMPGMGGFMEDMMKGKE